MTANGALTEYDHAPGEDVRAFYRDADGYRLIGMRQVVSRPADDSLATVYVHGIGHDAPHGFRAVVLDDGAEDHGFLSFVDGRQRQ